MEKGIPITVSKISNGFRIFAITIGEAENPVAGMEYFYPTKRALLAAINAHFVEKRVKEPPLDMVALAHQAAGIGEVSK